MGPANKADIRVFIIKHTVLYNSQSVVCHTKTALKTIPLIYTYDRMLMFKHGMEWSHRVTVLEVVCSVFIIYNIFICEIHSPFSKKSEDDLYVTGY